jgi:hypothetical protein
MPLMLNWYQEVFNRGSFTEFGCHRYRKTGKRAFLNGGREGTD